MFWERNGWVVAVYTKLEFGNGDLFAVDWPRLRGSWKCFWRVVGWEIILDFIAGYNCIVVE